MVKKAKSQSAKREPKTQLKKAEASEVADHPVRTLRDEIDRLFENFERGFGLGSGRTSIFDAEPFFEPFRRLEPTAFGKRISTDLAENDEEFRVNVELPGMAEEDVDVTYSDGMLTIKGEKEERSAQKDGDRHVAERRFGKFRRSFSLPETVDDDNVAATMKDGVLTIILPKLPEAKQKIKQVSIAKG